MLTVGSRTLMQLFLETLTAVICLLNLLLVPYQVSQAMSNDYLALSLSQTVKEALSRMLDTQQHCAIVVDNEGYLEGILTYSDIKRRLFKNPVDSSNKDLLHADVCVSVAVITSSSSLFVVNSSLYQLLQTSTSLVSSICTRGISYRGKECGLLTCYPDTDLATAKQLMEAKGIKQLPVIKRSRDIQKERKRIIVAILHYDSIADSIMYCLYSYTLHCDHCFSFHVLV